MEKKRMIRAAKNAGKLLLCFTAIAVIYTAYSIFIKFLLGKTGFVICTSVIVVLGVIYLGYIIARDEDKKGAKDKWK